MEQTKTVQARRSAHTMIRSEVYAHDQWGRVRISLDRVRALLRFAVSMQPSSMSWAAKPPAAWHVWVQHGDKDAPPG
jgi:hypothetical protein